MIPLLSKLTIVIPTYERQRFALRNMALWSGTDATVHVLDGSAEAISAELLESLASNIHYHHFPVPVWKRLAKVAALVDTEYVVLLGDDDLLVPSAVEASISELENNQDLVACCGRGGGKVLAADLIVHCSAIATDHLHYGGGAYGEVVQDDPVERMVFHMNPYNPSAIYAVCRSRAWLRSMRLVSAQQFSSGVVGELQFELSMSFYGKVKIINELMYLRSAENLSCVGTEEFKLEFHSWFVDPGHVREVESFLNVTADDLAATGTLDFETIRRGLERACRAYVAYCDSRGDISSPGTKKRSPPPVASTTLKTLIKKFIGSLPAPLLVALPERLRFRPYADIAKRLESSGIHVDWDQLNTVLKSVKEFHAGK